MGETWAALGWKLVVGRAAGRRLTGAALCGSGATGGRGASGACAGCLHSPSRGAGGQGVAHYTMQCPCIVSRIECNNVGDLFYLCIGKVGRALPVHPSDKRFAVIVRVIRTHETVGETWAAIKAPCAGRCG